MPVHRWCVRHLYIPLVGMGYSKTMGSIIVFFFSAFFHEYLVSLFFQQKCFFIALLLISGKRSIENVQSVGVHGHDGASAVVVHI